MMEELQKLLPEGESWVCIDKEHDYYSFYDSFIMGFISNKEEKESLKVIDTGYDAYYIYYFIDTKGYMFPICWSLYGDYWIRSSVLEEFKNSEFYKQDQEKIEKLQQELERMKGDLV